MPDYASSCLQSLLETTTAAPFMRVCCLSMHVSKTPGMDPEIEGGEHTQSGGGVTMRCAQHAQFFSVYNAQHCRACFTRKSF